MITFSKDHKLRLEKAKQNRFLDECIAKLNKLNLSNPYPKDKKQYKVFAEAGYANAKGYGLDDFPHHTYAYILAWHIKGATFIQYNEELLSFFKDSYIPSFVKLEKLLEMIDDNKDAVVQIKEMI